MSCAYLSSSNAIENQNNDEHGRADCECNRKVEERQQPSLERDVTEMNTPSAAHDEGRTKNISAA